MATTNVNRKVYEIWLHRISLRIHLCFLEPIPKPIRKRAQQTLQASSWNGVQFEKQIRDPPVFVEQVEVEHQSVEK